MRARSSACRTKPAKSAYVQHTSSYVIIRQHTSAYLPHEGGDGLLVCVALCEVYVVHHLQTLQSQHTPAYASTRQHTSACVTPAHVSIRQHTWHLEAIESGRKGVVHVIQEAVEEFEPVLRALRGHITQHTSAYVSIRERTCQRTCQHT